MKAKYFSADSLEAAEAKAEAWFSCTKDELEIEIIKGSEDDPNWQILALDGTPGELANADAWFNLYYETDGVFLEAYKERGAGGPLDSAELSKHLSRKNLSGANLTAIQNIVSARSGRVHVAPAQDEYVYGEDLSVEISKDEMQATARLLKPEPEGAKLDLDTAKKKLEEAGITFGLDEEAINHLLHVRDYGEPRAIARGIPPEDGEPGKLIFNFSTDERTGRPREIGGGRVDYRSLDLYEPVVENQLLVTRTLPTEGTEGTTVSGKQLKPKPGKEVNLPRGKNVSINDEKTEMYAKCSGMVEFINGSVNVTSVYKINGDCDLSVGNIDFDGSVHISGSVRSGHTIKATGGIVIGGAVEAATIIAGGNVEIKGGMQGADKGRVEAGGSITMMFIERGTAVADGSITVDVSIHSVLEAGGSLLAKGRRGAIIGGRAGAAGSITTNFIGAVSNTQTEIEVGMMPRKRARIQMLEKEIERLKGEMVKLDQLDTYLANQKGKIDQATWDKLHVSGAENRRVNEQTIEEFTEEANELRYEMEHATEGKVHVFDTAFQGVRIIIANGMFKVNNEVQYATFKYKDAEVVYGPCELTKSKD